MLKISTISNAINTKAIIAFGVLAGVVGFGAIAGHAQAQTTLNLQINAGVLTMYAGDNTDNDDICTPADDGNQVELVTCSAAERTATLSALTVSSVRQNTTTTIHDILFEDLRGLATATYTVDAQMCNLTDGTKTITLGSNPDNLADDTDTDAPTTSGDEGKLFATLDPSAAGTTITVLRPQSAIDQYQGDNTLYSRGSKQTVISTGTQVTVFETTDSVIPARAELDGATLKHRVPAFVQAGNYSCQMTFTVA